MSGEQEKVQISTPALDFLAQSLLTLSSAPARDDYEEEISGDDLKYNTEASQPQSSAPSQGGRGLRQFSMMVCNEVRDSGVTTYQEVANRLVAELRVDKNSEEVSGDDTKDDSEKNIRRRVYDALNVLLALKIIEKEKKEIRWIGLTSSIVEQAAEVEASAQIRRQSLKRKKEDLEDMILEYIPIRQCRAKIGEVPLVENDRREESWSEAEPECASDNDTAYIRLPFIVVSAPRGTEVSCEMGEGFKEVGMSLSQPYYIERGEDVLRRMGLDRCRKEDLSNMLPVELQQYVPKEVIVDQIAETTPAGA